MLKDDQTITMTYADFQNLIKEEVRRQSGEINRNELFPSPIVVREKLNEVNFSNKFIMNSVYEKTKKEEMAVKDRKDKGIDRMIWYRTESEIEEISKNRAANYSDVHGAKKTFSETEIHNLIRKLSLAVFGMTLNSDARMSEFPYLNEYYYKFLDLFSEFYQERIEREFPEQK